MESHTGSNWYALYTRARWEKRVKSQLEEHEIYCYLPLYKTLRNWSDRKKSVIVPLFSSYVFVKISQFEQQKVLSISGVARIVSFDGTPVIIPERQIEAIKRILSKGIDVEPIDTKFKPGDKIEVMQGSLRGLKGELIEYRGKKKIAIRLDVIEKSIIINIPVNHVKTLA